MIIVTAEGEVVKVAEYETRDGAPVKRVKLSCLTGQGQWQRTIAASFYGTHDELAAVKRGDMVKLEGVPRAKSMITDDGSDVAWLEMQKARVIHINGGAVGGESSAAQNTREFAGQGDMAFGDEPIVAPLAEPPLARAGAVVQGDKGKSGLAARLSAGFKGDLPQDGPATSVDDIPF